jgi:hypothetical protein
MQKVQEDKTSEPSVSQGLEWDSPPEKANFNNTQSFKLGDIKKEILTDEIEEEPVQEADEQDENSQEEEEMILAPVV